MQQIPKWVSIWVMVMLVAVLAFPAGMADAQEPKRLKIGLALGGGGALGFSHIGVLKWLEENRIPVDRIAGTSMGGLIGALYAMGMSPQEIEDLMKTVDWEGLFKSDPPYNILTFRRKEDRRDYPAQIKIGARNGIRIPTGLSVYPVSFLLSRLALAYSSVDSFEELPIPFCCVATDIRNCEGLVLKDGSLSGALRATMSLPGVFAPVERDGKLLVDGGLVNNVPADVVKSQGVDKVIAVNCNDSNENRDLRRMDSFLLGAINCVIVNNTQNALEAADLVLHPQVAGATAMDWTEVGKFITSGYWAAAGQSAQLKSLALDEAAWRKYLQERAARKRTEPIVPQGVEVVGTNTVNIRNIKRSLEPLVGKPLDVTKLEDRLTEVMGTSFYESIRYEIRKQDERQVLLVTVIEKFYGPPFIDFGLQALVGGTWNDFSLRTRGTAFNVWGRNSELRADLTLGKSPVSNIELYKPLGNRPWFAATHLDLELKYGSYFRDGRRWTDYKTGRQDWGLDLGYSGNRYAEFRLGYELWHQNLDSFVGEPLPTLEGYGQKLSMKWSYMKAEGKGMLKPGTHLKIQANHHLKAPEADEQFTTLESQMRWIGGFGKCNLILAKLAAGATVEGETPFLQQFTLGGPFKLSAHQVDELRGENYCLGMLGFLKPLGKEIYGNRVYLGIVLEGGGVFSDWSDPETQPSFSLGMAGSTPFGMAWLGASCGEEERMRIYLTLGREF